MGPAQAAALGRRQTMPQAASGAWPARRFAAWFVVLFAVTQVPLYAVRYPDIVDYPNHLARLYVLLHGAESAWLQRYYELRPFRFGTNLAMDWAVPWLATALDLPLALKVFATLTMLVLTSGAAALGRAVTGRFTGLLLGVLLFAHNAMFQLGLMNYLLGVGLALWLLAAWVACGARRRGAWASRRSPRVACFSMAAT